jgi:hypothetical protein
MTRVMPALVAGIQVFVTGRKKDVDGWDRPGHDEGASSVARRQSEIRPKA